MRGRRRLQPPRRPVASGLVARLTVLIEHRGPDGGRRVHGRPRGSRPSPPRDHRPEPAGTPADGDAGRCVVLDYNGEIYNFQRAAGGAAGARSPFPLAHRHRGPAPRLRRMGPRHASTGSTGCSRSRSGTAPSPPLPGAGSLRRQAALLGPAGTRLLFASEIKAILAHPRVSREALLRGIERVLHLPERPHRPRRSSTAFAFCPPGCTLTLEVRDGSRAVHRRATGTFDFATSRRDSPDGAARSCDRLSSTGSSRQLVSDVPVGSYLSGGMDSASITAIAAQRRTRPPPSPAASISARRPVSSSPSTSAAQAEEMAYVLQDRALRGRHARRGHGVGDVRS